VDCDGHTHYGSLATIAGSHGSGVFVLGGYLATEHNWQAISEAWKVALDEEPRVDYFHMGSNYHGDPPFEDWEESVRIAKRYRMLEVLKQFNASIVELSSTIAWDDYNSLDSRFRQAFPNPYFFCFHGIVSLAKDWLVKNDPMDGPVHVAYTFDIGSALESRIQDHFFAARARYPQFEQYIGGLCFDDDRQLPGLQMADLIAWLLRRDIVKPKQDDGKTRADLLFLRQHYAHDAQSRKWRGDELHEFWRRTEAKLATLELE
jgi:uncharacterized protein DUF3800